MRQLFVTLTVLVGLTTVPQGAAAPADSTDLFNDILPAEIIPRVQASVEGVVCVSVGGWGNFDFALGPACRDAHCVPPIGACA